MKLIYSIFIATLLSATTLHSSASAPFEITITKGTNAPVTKEIIKEAISAISRQKGLPEGKIKEIEWVIGGKPGNTLCPNGESTWNPKAVGDGGQSLGLVQIHLPSHPTVTKEQALDYIFAINFIVDEFLSGNEKYWTCWRALSEQQL